MLNLPANFNCALKIYIRPADGQSITTASVGQVEKNCVTLTREVLANQRTIEIKVG
jgi:hypothetical protein